MPQSQIIVCVEDDEYVREALGGLLRSFGFVAETYASAEEFLSSGPFGRVACLVTDVQLGGISGLELLEELTASGVKIPAIVITAHAVEGIREISLRAGATEFFIKPIVANDFVSAIEKAIGN